VPDGKTLSWWKLYIIFRIGCPPFCFAWIHISWKSNGKLGNSFIRCQISVWAHPPGWVEDSKPVVDVGAEGGVDILGLVLAHPLQSQAPTSIAFPLKSQQSFMFSGLWLFYQVLCSKLSQLLLCLILQLKGSLYFKVCELKCIFSLHQMDVKYHCLSVSLPIKSLS